MEEIRASGCLFLALSMSIAAGCGLIDDDTPPDPVGGTGGSTSDNQVCIEAIDSLVCPAGFAPLIVFDGGTANVTLIDDPGVAVGLLGALLNFGAGADWLATSITQNSVCTVGCVAACQTGQDGCFAQPQTGASCSFCASSISEQGCIDFVDACMPSGGTTSGGAADTSGGVDSSSGGADTSGGLVYDCAGWNPSDITTSSSGTKLVPQYMVNQLVLNSGDPLVECDGVLFEQTTSGFFRISEMGSDGFLQRLGFQFGDELFQLDGQDLDSTDALATILVQDFYTASGRPKSFGPKHPGFGFRVKRGRGTVFIPIRVD